MIKILEYINIPYIVDNGYSFQLYRDDKPVSIEYATYEEAEEALNNGDYQNPIANDFEFFGRDIGATKEIIGNELGYVTYYNYYKDIFEIVDWGNDTIKQAYSKLRRLSNQTKSKMTINYNRNKGCIEVRIY